MFIAGAYFFVYAAQFLSCSLRQKHPLLDVNPVGSTFNIQNSIPHKSQKPKAVAETNRAKEFQRGTAGVLESAKEGVTGLSEGSDIGLGSRDRAFESPHSDQNPLKSVDFRGFFLFIVYCGAEFEECRYGKKCDNSMFSCNLFRYVL